MTISRSEVAMRIVVRVIPRSSKNALTWEQGSGTLKVRLTAPPVDGAANEALVALLAEKLAIPRRDITIVRGATGRQKTLDIAGFTPETLQQKLAGQ
ncbi:MAG TPA: DUF167 domain-containing protein [Ktedonobacteraceae bacterium]|nr:DUF167 domain-containing protein [Ktedonobacteraceae bacterium]